MKSLFIFFALIFAALATHADAHPRYVYHHYGAPAFFPFCQVLPRTQNVGDVVRELQDQIRNPTSTNGILSTNSVVDTSVSSKLNSQSSELLEKLGLPVTPVRVPTTPSQSTGDVSETVDGFIFSSSPVFDSISIP